ncbi:MAG: NUDIX domain-containing protein [Candidatus Hinthialibacter antarcticus]|nr:NUDIX domain-containing protein [Candidatus Hinthialibacter antarcticus]
MKSKTATKSVVKKTAAKLTKTKAAIKKKITAKKAVVKKTTVKKIAKSKTSKPSNRKTATKKTAAKKIIKKTVPPQKASSKKSSSPKSVSKKLVAAKKPAPRRRPTVHKSNTPQFPPTSWGSGAEIHFEATEHQPPRELTCVAGGFVFYQDKLVLANIPGRGWEIIGGRIDIGEAPEETFRREAQQQIGITFSKVKMLGVIRIQHTGPEPPNCPYPYPIGYGIQYIAIADELVPFHGGEESLGRSLISAEGLKEHYFDWNEHNEAVFKYAFSVYHKWRKKLDRE